MTHTLSETSSDFGKLLHGHSRQYKTANPGWVIGHISWWVNHSSSVKSVQCCSKILTHVRSSGEQAQNQICTQFAFRQAVYQFIINPDFFLWSPETFCWYNEAKEEREKSLLTDSDEVFAQLLFPKPGLNSQVQLLTHQWPKNCMK